MPCNGPPSSVAASSSAPARSSARSAASPVARPPPAASRRRRPPPTATWAGARAEAGTPASPAVARRATPSPSSPKKKATASSPAPWAAARARRGPAVHAELVVPNKDGNGFITVTMDSGTVKSVNGDQVTITEGTDKATYKDATLTIPSDATVRRNFADAKLSDLKDGDHVHVSQSSEGTVVFAIDAAHEDQRPGPGWGHGAGRPGPYGGPPPGGP